jgi:hypothetical protein
MILPQDFKEFLQLLKCHQVEYLLVGGYAVGYYGYPRATADMDIWINRTQENAEKMVKVLEEFGFNIPGLSSELFLKEHQIIRMGVPPIKIEILTTISGVNFEECFIERSLPIIDEVEVSLISLNKLKKNKKASGRLKDLNDLENLP